MSFYGNIINKIQNFFTSVKTDDGIIIADTEKDIITFKGKGFLSIKATDNDKKIITFDDSSSEIKIESKIENSNLIYTITQGNTDPKHIIVPIAPIVRTAELVENPEEGKTGTYLKLVVAVGDAPDSSYEKTLYIDMNILDEKYSYSEIDETLNIYNFNRKEFS